MQRIIDHIKEMFVKITCVRDYYIIGLKTYVPVPQFTLIHLKLTISIVPPIPLPPALGHPK